MLSSATVAAPAACSDAKLAEIRAAAAPGTGAVLIDCQLDLAPTDVITKALYFNHGAVSNDVVVDCHGATLAPNAYNTALPRILVQSYFDAASGAWIRPENITVRACHLLGHLRVNGMGSTTDPTVRDSSRINADHSARMRDAAPRGIDFDGLVVETQNHTAAYLNVGTTYVTIRNSQFLGSSNSVVIYLEAESGWNQILDNQFQATAAREVIAVDGSAENLIRGNTFADTHLGGIYLYRNCGEGGTVRHATPQKNGIEANQFLDAAGPRNGYPHVFVASRNGNRSCCENDAGYPYGSSVSNLDCAQYTEIKGNHFQAVAGAKSKAVVLNAGPSYLVDNRSNLLSALPAKDAWGSFFSHNTAGLGTDTTSSCFYRTGLPMLIRSGQYTDLDLSQPKAAVCSANEADCNAGLLASRPSICQGSQLLTATVKCAGKAATLACSRSVECPAGQQIHALKLACDLDSGAITSAMLDGLDWNTSKVFSVASSHASCRVDGQAVQAGWTQVLDFPKQRAALACTGDTATGKNCSLSGQYVCR